jgi:hypothetical protein
LNGFEGTITISAQGVPSDITLSPAPPYSLTQSGSQSFTLAASRSAGAAAAAINFQATSGSLAHSASLTLTISAPPCGLVAPLPRVGFYRLNASPLGAVYDPTRKQFFVSNHDANTVEVYSPSTMAHLASIPVSQPFGLDISPDGTTVLAGSSAAVLTLIDPTLLQVKSRVTVPVTGLLYSALPYFPVYTSNGTVLISTGSTNALGNILLQWNPATGQFIERTPTPTYGQVARIARSGDYSKVIIAPDSEGVGLALYNAAADSFSVVAPIPGGGFAGEVAANPDGSRFAMVLGDEYVILDQNLNPIFTSAQVFPAGVIFSLDGTSMYGSSTAAGTGLVTVQAVRMSDLTMLGQVSSLGPESAGNSNFIGPLFLAIDETGLLVEGGELGVGFIDVSQPASSLATSALFGDPAFNPQQSAVNTATSVTISGGGFPNCAGVYFGSLLGTNTTASTNTIDVTAPASTTPGPVNVAFYFPDGSISLLPDGFNYGPDILYLSLAGGTPAGGTQVHLMGYGFDFSQSNIQVSVGGQAASIQGISTYPGISPFPFPLNHIYFTTPSGSAGPADVSVTTPAGSTTLPGGFNYFSQTYTAGSSQGIAAILYDRFRKQVYMTDQVTNSVKVFSLSSKSFLNDLPAGKGPLAMALTPDGSELLVTNTQDLTLTIVNPDNPANVSTVQIVPTSAAEYIGAVAAGAGKAFVQSAPNGIDGCVGVLREVDLTTLAVSTPAVNNCLPESFLLNSTGDGSEVYMFGLSLSNGPIWTWDASSGSISGPAVTGFNLFDSAVSFDGNRLAVNNEILDSLANYTGVDSIPYLLSDLAAQMSSEKFDPSGAWVYVPFSNYIDIFDANTGNLRLRLALPATLQSIWDAFAVDETGSEMFALTQNGLTVMQLAAAPLGIGSVTPATGSMAGGTQVTLRGCGFQSGVSIKMGTLAVAATMTDSETLKFTTPAATSAGPVRITVTNPNGAQYFLDAAFQYTSP